MESALVRASCHLKFLPASISERRKGKKKQDNIFPLSSFQSQVSLLPPALARKRVWNKKYPICITLAEGEVVEESVVEGLEEGERAEKHTVADHQLPVTLYLFGRTGREKEEWFQHFLSASRAGAKDSVSREQSPGKPCSQHLRAKISPCSRHDCH